MDRLRDGFVDFMRLRGNAERTMEAYTTAAGKVVRFCGDKPPRRTEEHEIRAYLLHLKEGKAARGTFSIALGGTRQLFAGYLGSDRPAYLTGVLLRRPIRRNLRRFLGLARCNVLAVRLPRSSCETTTSHDVSSASRRTPMRYAGCRSSGSRGPRMSRSSPWC